MQFLKQIFQDIQGNPSMMRTVQGLTNIVILGTWAYTSFKQGALMPLDPEIVAVLLGTNGIKAFQRKVEQGPDSPAKLGGDS